MKTDKFIDLGDIYLRGVSEKDIKGEWYTWLNDKEVTKYQNKGIIPNTFEKQKSFFEYLSQSQEDIVFSIIHNGSNKHIGVIGLHKIDYIHRSAEVGFVIGKKEHWAKGYGYMCVDAVKKYSFDTLNLHRLMAIVIKKNMASHKIFIKAGFEEEGLMKDFLFKNGVYHDAFIMGCLNSTKY
jgi:[ribosomal protein S5]-alanine N-acetyltransferase